MKFNLSIFFVFITSTTLFAQLVTVEEIVQMALQKNYDVRVIQNSAASASNDNRFAFGAFLPQVNASGVYNKITNNSQNLTFTATENIFPEAKATGTNASVQLVWPIFDGTRMFATRKRISELLSLAEINVRNQMSNTAASVTTTYYTIVRQKQHLKAILEQMSVGEERVKVAERKLQVGTGGKPELLQAKVDLNALRTAVIQQETLIRQLKDLLNGALAMSLADSFEVADTIPINLILTIEQISADIERTNQQLASVKKSIDVARLQVRESRRSRSPIVNFISGYNIINKNENEVQVTPATQKLTRSTGYNYGLSVSVPIMTGMNVNRLIGQSKINLERQELIYDQQLALILVGVRVAFVNYENAKRTLLIEEENILLAKENVTIALESFKRGVATYIELRTAQQSLADAYNRLIAARYNAKISETELLRLNGSLLN